MDELVEKIDILGYIAQYVELKPKGNEFVGLSPFTHEKTPSFFVCPQKHFWYCFSCGEGGTVIKFVEKYHKVSYHEAIKILSNWGHIALNEEESFTTIVRRYRKKEEEVMPVRKILPTNVMQNYKDILIKSWVEERNSQRNARKVSSAL